MHYRSIADMHDAIVRGLHRLPRDLDLVVGIPRSGTLAANLISLVANVAMTGLEHYAQGRFFSSGSTKAAPPLRKPMSEMRRVLVIDDSINTGAAMREARARISASRTVAELTFAAVYGVHLAHREVDLVLEVVPKPRM